MNNNKQSLDEIFVISKIIKVEVSVNTYRDLDYLGYHKNRTHRCKEPELILFSKIMHCAHNLQSSQLFVGR